MITFVAAPTDDAERRARVVDTAIGPLRVVVVPEGVVAIEFHPFSDAHADTPDAAAGEYPVLDATVVQLQAYFAGELTDFDLPLAPRGTEYQLRVWEALTRVPHGTTATYAQIAAALGQVPGASRAVGLANGRNPIPVVVPCHRIIGSNGALTGYAGGLERKQVLLDLEKTEGETLF